MGNTLKLREEYKVATEDRETFKALPENMPDVKWTAKQKETISRMYYQYLSKIDNADWNMALYRMEQKEKWPSGPRMSKYGAMYICLNFIMDRKEEMTAKDFWHCLNGREAFVRVTKFIYSPY